MGGNISCIFHIGHIHYWWCGLFLTLDWYSTDTIYSPEYSWILSGIKVVHYQLYFYITLNLLDGKFLYPKITGLETNSCGWWQQQHTHWQCLWQFPFTDFSTTQMISSTSLLILGHHYRKSFANTIFTSSRWACYLQKNDYSSSAHKLQNFARTCVSISDHLGYSWHLVKLKAKAISPFLASHLGDSYLLVCALSLHP